MKVVVATDAHYDWTTLGVSRFGEVAAAMDHAVTHAIAHRAGLFVFAGDLAETSGAGMLRGIEHAVQCASRLWQQHIPSLWLTGNHDVIEDGLRTSNLAPLRDVPGTVLADEPMMVNFGEMERFHKEGKKVIRVCALPFTPRTHGYDPALFVASASDEGLEPPDLIVAHLMLEGIGPGSETRDMPRGRNVFWPLDAIERHWPKALKVGGHYHTNQVFRGVHLPGSLCRLMQVEASNTPVFLTATL